MLPVLLCFWAVLIYYLGAQWFFFPEYNYGWAVPCLCLYLIWGKTEIGKPKAEIEQKETGNARQASTATQLSAKKLAFLVLTCCALLYAPTRLIHEASPTWRLTTLLWALQVLGISLALVYLRYGWERMRAVAPAMCFFLVAVPWPSILEEFVQGTLSRLNAQVSAEILAILGIPAIQKGNLIELGTGVLGIEKACSGIQSLQASLMLSLFFGLYYRLRLSRFLWLVLGGCALALGCNVIRTSVLGVIAARNGLDAANRWHDPAGVLILLACFGGICISSRMLRGNGTRPEEHASAVPGRWLHCRKPATIVTVLLVWFILVEVSVEGWYRVHEIQSAVPVHWGMQWPVEEASFQRVELKPGVRRMLQFDHGESGKWQGADGSAYHAIYFAWAPRPWLYDRISVSPYHNPEVCNKAAGWKLKKTLPPATLLSGAGFPLNFRRMVFENDGRIMHLFFAITDYDGPGAIPAALRMKRWDMFDAAIAGTRLFGQRTLEIGVTGFENAEQATAALQQQLQKIIRVETSQEAK